MQLDGVAALETLLTDGAQVERLSLLTESEPLVVVARDEEDATRLDGLDRVPNVTVLVGGVGRAWADSFDLCISTSPDPPPPHVHAPLAGVTEQVAAHPLAALALVGLLRSTRGIDTWAGLASESATYSALLGGRDFKRWLDGLDVGAHRAGDEPAVLVERDGGTLVVTLNRPQVHNAFDREMRDGLVEALQLGQAGDLAIELRGAGPSFCSGGDLTEFGTVIDPPTANAVRLTRHPGWWVHTCRDRLTVKVHGACVGAGVELPAFAGRVESTADATFRLPEVGMGLVPGAGGTVSITRRIGRQRCAWLALTGTSIDAPTAQAWGLIDAVTA